MMSTEEIGMARHKARETLEHAGIILTPDEAAGIEVADFGLGALETTGLQLITYINTQRVCAKELVLLPFQTCPEHRHPSVDGEPGKEETFRCRHGLVRLYVEGEPTSAPETHPPAARAGAYTAAYEVVLRPGEQYTILPDIRHWFQGGEDGAVVSEFSTRSRDEKDIFTDPDILR